MLKNVEYYGLSHENLIWYNYTIKLSIYINIKKLKNVECLMDLVIANLI